MGLFGNNYGTIKNVKIVNSNITLFVKNVTGDVGGIAAKNYNIIDNCCYIGNLSIYGDEDTTGLMRIGGIASGNENAIIKNTFFSGNIIANKTVANSVSYAAGGITAGNSGEIYQCYSIGKMECKNIEYVSGISANCSGIIKNCYNTMKIYVEDGYACGGIVGWDKGGSNTNVSYCYSIGNVYTDGNIDRIGGIFGIYSGGATYNCYCLDILQAVGDSNSSESNYDIKEMTESEMKASNFINLLNQENENIWKQDINNKNNGYPILYWQ